MKNDIAKIENIIDEDFNNMKLWEWNRDFALLSICIEYERGIYILNNELSGVKSFEDKNKILIKYSALFDSLDWLIRKVYECCSVQGGKVIEDIQNIKEYDTVIEEAFYKAEVHKTMEDIFSPYWAGLYNGKVLENENGELEVYFTYFNQRTAELEGINSVLRQENHSYQKQKLNNLQRVLQKQKIRNINDVEYIFSMETSLIIKNLFDLPDNFEIGPYKINEIKRVWHQVLFEVWYKNYENKIILDKAILNDIEITDLRVNNWPEIQGIKKETIINLLDDLTYTGARKGNQKHSTPRTSPIFRLTDGKYVVSPNFIINNSSQRNIVATLGHIYADETNRESEIKESFFITELNIMLGKYPHILSAQSVAIPDTNVDYVLCDPQSKTMCLFELKWILEPVSAREIKNKDTDISKGLFEQLPKYNKEIDNNLSGFIKKVFKKEVDVEQVYYFVLTRDSIGSGLISPTEYKVINIRMLNKALYDTKGCLRNTAVSLYNEIYYPKKSKDFNIVNITKKVGDILIHSEGIIHLSDEFNLSVDDYYNI